MRTKLLGLAALLAVAPVMAADSNAGKETKPSDPEAAYRRVIDKRVSGILTPLELSDTAKSNRVHSILVEQYRALNDWHNANDAKRKGAKGEELERINAPLKAIHEKFIAALAQELTPGQIETVKDGMTYGKVEFTYRGYMNVYPDLAEEHRAKVLELLKEAREQAMDAGSSEEKSAIFNRYKGKINNYLAAHGVSAPKKNKSSTTSPNDKAGK